MKELLSTFLETSKDRLKNPFISSFILSWLAFNWKPLFIILFSSKNIENKILLIETKHVSIFLNLWLPLSFALFYIILLPYLMWLLEELSTKAIKARKTNFINQKVFDIQNNQNIAKEEVSLENIRANYKEKADLNKQIENLKSQILEKDSKIKELNDDMTKLKNEYQEMSTIIQNQSPEQKTTMDHAVLEQEYNEFNNADMYEYFQEVGTSIRTKGKFPSNINDLIIEKYKLSDLITKEYDSDRDTTYHVFTDKGNYFWKLFLSGIHISKTTPMPPFIEEDAPPF
jgi:hypothetical protein